MPDDIELSLFKETVWEYYGQNGRHDLPWRQPAADGFDPYSITVSELMLQQTQVQRVIPKYLAFLERFPTLQALAAAPLGDALRAWSGLGYNRRAKYLHQAAQAVAAHYGGEFPDELHELTKLPGIGVNTAGAVLAYAYNKPAIFLETNIRTVYIHHFFADGTDIPDKDIHEIVAATADAENPREWYWALMDYGSHVKKTSGNLRKASRGYAKQSVFHGSRRQLRGQVIKLLAAEPMDRQVLAAAVPDERLPSVLEDLLGEGLITESDGKLSL